MRSKKLVVLFSAYLYLTAQCTVYSWYLIHVCHVFVEGVELTHIESQFRSHRTARRNVINAAVHNKGMISRDHS